MASAGGGHVVVLPAGFAPPPFARRRQVNPAPTPVNTRVDRYYYPRQRPQVVHSDRME